MGGTIDTVFGANVLMYNKVRKLSRSTRMNKVRKRWGGDLVGATALDETKAIKE